MKISFITLFPEMYTDFLSTSIVGRAVNKGQVETEVIQLRDFSHDRYRHVDDTPFGGGAGMVLKCQPVIEAIESVRKENSYVIMMAPAGRTFTQRMAHSYSGKEHLIFLCGHYEGFDARIENYVDDIVSIGDYVLTGGELASMVIADAVIRLCDGVIKADSTDEESYENGLLEYPQYTQPAEFRGARVPDVLLSGHHENIRRWRLTQSLVTTRRQRPDLFEKHELSREERKLLERYDEESENHD